MKKFKVLLAVPLVAGVLYGCNKDEVKDVPEKAPVETSTKQEENKHAAESALFNFTEFSLDVDYSATESYDVDYDNERSGMEAELEDNRNNEKLYGDEAFTKLEPLFKQLTFDSATPNDEVIDQVISVFKIADDFQSIEIEVKFADGTKKEYERIK
ncbi:YusW family protein [Lysinibacillus sp. NPDC097287]|uniref:YusW family protein n=1 Tax=Lysinibacillus sp. NPDC097287 TaxID=3364144 RepID=UPI003814B4D3